MAESQPPSRSNTPTILPPQRRPLEEDHVPAVPSPLNPDAAAPARTRPARAPAPAREQREKKDSLKKRESTAGTRGSTPDVKRKGPAAPSPMRYSIPEPRLSDYEPVKDPVFVSHEPTPFLAPDGSIELKKPVDHAQNKKDYRYTHCVADPLFRHKQFYRQSDSKPYGPRMSFEDSDRWMHFDESGTYVTNEKGWRMSRGNVAAREGSLYYEVKIIHGVPATGPAVPADANGQPQPHIRMGWARREAPLDAPVGFDGYSYGITDIRFETMHRSRPGKFLAPAAGKPSKSKVAAAAAKPKPGAAQQPAAPEHEHVRTGDVLGLLITLPSLTLHRKVVAGTYNPAVDIGDGFHGGSDDAAAWDGAAAGSAPPDVIRDRIPVPYRGNLYFESFEYAAAKPVEAYAERGPTAAGARAAAPHPNHEEACLRSLPHSAVRVFRNGRPAGTAFENLLAFLPPASVPYPVAGARPGFDDGMVGYFPAVAAFSGGIAQVNFGPHFWFPPPELARPDAGSVHGERDVAARARSPRAIGERFKEQIAEDIVWDLVDEADFFVQDGGYAYAGESGGGVGKTPVAARGMADLRDD